MNEFPPNSAGIVVVTSEAHDDGSRVFSVAAPDPEDAPTLGADVRHEQALLAEMERLGYRLTMVGGGSRVDEARRFYFRRSSDAAG